MLTRRTILLLSIGALILAAFSFAGGYYIHKPVVTAREIRDDYNSYRFIDPLIAVNIGPKRLFPEYKSLESDIQSYIDDARTAGKLSSASVYFKELLTDQWTGVNETELYAPSSMMKVIVMLAILDHAEKDPSILQKELLYIPTANEEYFKDKVLSAGYHTIKELVESMIVYSDNDALTALFKYDSQAVAGVSKALDLPSPDVNGGMSDFMSPIKYSLVFRTLFNASFLSRDVSESALDLLSQTTFKDGIVAGVPEGTRVAHKFGERTNIEDGKVTGRELHDCGIVYYPNKPYLLCVMTKGSDFNDLSKAIADISKIVYDKVI